LDQNFGRHIQKAAWQSLPGQGGSAAVALVVPNDDKALINESLQTIHHAGNDQILNVSEQIQGAVR
jgi:hypothetical protein